jgi:hypothetical protein
MRPIRPDPSEYPKIQKAFRAARFMKWWSGILLVVSGFFSIMVGLYTVWYLGLGLLLLLWGILLVGGFSQARCPHCGQVWWSILVFLPLVPIWLLIVPEDVEETNTFVCRRCRLDIGMGLK